MERGRYKDREDIPFRNGGGMHQVSGGVDLDVGVLGLPHRVGSHPLQQLVHGGGGGKKVQK